MSTQQLIAVIGLVMSLVGIGISIGVARQRLDDYGQRIQKLEAGEHYIHGDLSQFLKKE